jgi:hypothetical protein
VARQPETEIDVCSNDSETEAVIMENKNYMKCAEFEEILHELDRPGTKGYELREEALIHAESCGRCGVLLTETESLDFSLARIASEADRGVASPRVEAALLHEFRRVKGKPARWRMQWRVAAVGIAAALFLALGLSLARFYTPLRSLGGAPQANLAKSGAETDRSSESDHPDSQSSRKTVRDSMNKKSVTPQVPEQAADQSDETEVAENFTPLPYADDPSMMEGGSVVRVILSRSALASLGMPVSGVENTEQIPADLVVSADGTPEAIRLVAQN